MGLPEGYFDSSTSQRQKQNPGKGFPILSLTGPRHSGKTTLARALYPDYHYINLEDLDERVAAEEDPIRLLKTHAPTGVIVDEIQQVPLFFSRGERTAKLTVHLVCSKGNPRIVATGGME